MVYPEVILEGDGYPVSNRTRKFRIEKYVETHRNRIGRDPISF